MSPSEFLPMTHVVLEIVHPMQVYTDCVDVCPVDAPRGPNFLTIDPNECIDCAVLHPSPGQPRIVPEEDVPGDSST